MQQTSLTAYYQLKQDIKNGTYNAILSVLSNWKEGLTDMEIASILGYSDPNKVRPRRNELVKMGYVSDGKKRICKITGKQALTWHNLQSISSNIDNRVIYPPSFPMEKIINNKNKVYTS
jgi:hypothetical protein